MSKRPHFQLRNRESGAPQAAPGASEGSRFWDVVCGSPDFRWSGSRLQTLHSRI